MNQSKPIYAYKGVSGTMKYYCIMFLLFHFFGMRTAKGAQDEEIDLTSIPLQGALEISDLGKTLNRDFSVGEDLVEFNSEPTSVETEEVFSSASC